MSTNNNCKLFDITTEQLFLLTEFAYFYSVITEVCTT